MAQPQDPPAQHHRQRQPKTPAHWDATADCYRRWRASRSSSKGQLRSFIRDEFKQRGLSGHKGFWQKALMWRALGLTAERLGEKTEDIRFQDLANGSTPGTVTHSLSPATSTG
jgi:hypothetical protein